MLTRLDDYPIHQTPEPLAHPSTGDRNFYDRYFFNGYTRDGSLFFAVALGLYPNRRVMDAAVSVVRGGVQRNLRASRLAPAERTATTVGPIAVEIVEPMRVQRIHIHPNEHGIEGELTMRARALPLEEPRIVRHSPSGRVNMDSTRFVQLGTWEGWLAVDGERIDVDPASVLGCRDRSWGVRGVGEREGGAPGDGPRQFFWLWAPVNFDGLVTHFGTNEDADGIPWHRNGIVAAAGFEGAPERAATASHSVQWEPGTRRARAAHIELAMRDGRSYAMDFEPLMHFHMVGVGYGHPEWGHGMWRGEEAVGGDSWSVDGLDPLDPRHLHIQSLCRTRLTGGDGSQQDGIGVLEQLVIGPHAPSGFRDTLDGAR